MEFRIVPHRIESDTQVVEIWNGESFIGTIVGGKDTHNPSIRIVSKYPRINTRADMVSEIIFVVN